MNEIILNQVVETNKNNLTTRFVVTGIIAIILIVTVMTLRGYYVLRSSGVENEAHRVGVKVSEVVDMVSEQVDKVEAIHILRIGESFKHLNGVESATLYTPDLKPIWPDSSKASFDMKNERH
jgi:hypothetical protein